MTTENISFINKLFNFEAFAEFDADFTAYEAHFSESAAITVICCIAKSSDFIRKNWEAITDVINHDYLVSEISMFEHWNTYLLFACDELIDKPLQYQIENNKFAMRKLVAELPVGVDTKSAPQTISVLLSKKLLLNEIVLNEKTQKSNNWKNLLSESGKNIVNSAISFSLNDADKKSRNTWIEKNVDKDVKF
jgi:hypothetical protein